MASTSFPSGPAASSLRLQSTEIERERGKTTSTEGHKRTRYEGFGLRAMWLKGETSPAAPSSGRSVGEILRPLALLGAFLGVFPYSRMPPAAAPQEIPATGPSPVSLISAWGEGKPNPAKGAGNLDEKPLGPPYRLLWCSPHAAIAAVWVSLLVLGYAALGGPVLNFIRDNFVSSLQFVFWFIGGYISPAYVCWWWLLLFRRRRLEAHLALLDRHHRANPTRGFRPLLAMALGLASTLLNVLVPVEVALESSVFGDAPSAALNAAMVVHGTAMGNVMLSVAWVLFAHHREQLGEANARMAEALRGSDLGALRASRRFLMEVRALCLGTEETFTTGMLVQVNASMVAFCFGLALLSVISTTDAVHLSVAVATAFTVGSVMQVFASFLLGDQCAKAAQETVLLLQGHGEGTDGFSREVNNIRRDLDTAPLVLTGNEYLEFTLLGLWPVLQYVFTQMVLLIQFTQFDINIAQNKPDNVTTAGRST